MSFKNLATICTLVALLAISNSNSQNPDPNSFDRMGSTTTKEFYISHTFTNDFADAIATCSIRLGNGLRLVAIESEEEKAVIDSYFSRTQGNNSDFAWTSYVSLGGGPRWATGGVPANVIVDVPWPAGGGGSPTWAWYECGTIRRTCYRPPNSPPGCWPAATNILLTSCKAQHRFICQRTGSFNATLTYANNNYY